MGQFKPMVKMMTTEPSVELKLKKGGAVKMMNGGVMGGLAAAPAAVPARGGMMPAARPKKPGMAARRAAMMGRPMMKEGGETKAEHKAEMEAIKGVDRKLSKHAEMAASKAHKGLKTGGVVMGQAGFKEGGVIKSTKGETKMVTAEGEHHTPKKTGEVVMGKPGGYKHGGKAKKMARGGMFGVTPGSRRAVSEIDPQFRANFAGPYEGYTPEPEYPDDYKYAKGGKTKKYAKGGGVEGNVSTSKPGKTNTTTGEVRLGNAGGFKKGGSAKKAYAAGGSVNDSGRPVAYPKKPASASVKNNLQSGTFKKGGGVKMNEGGKIPAEAQSAIKQADAERAYREYEKSETQANKAMRESILGAPKRMFDTVKGMFSKEAPPGSVTKTEKSVTVAPSKKRGGRVKC